MRTLFAISLFCFLSISCFGAETIFDVKIIPLIIDPELDFWVYTPPNTGPNIPMTEKVYQNQTFMLFMPSRVTPLQQQEKVAITYDIKLTSSIGKIILNEKNLKYYEGPLPGQKLLLPDNHIVEMAFDNTESPGEYIIDAVFYEKVSNREHKASVEIELIEYKRPEPFTSDEAMSEWTMNYFNQPDPIRSFSAILYHVKLSSEWIEGNGQTLAFYRRIFQDNPFLWEYYAELYKTVSDTDKRKMLLAISVTPSCKGKEAFLEDVKGEMQEFYDNASKIVLPDTHEEITKPLQLDILWSEFFASGTYKPIRRIVSALELRQYDEIVEKVKSKEIPEFTDEIKRQFMLGVVFQAAEWSLVSNCMQFHRAHQYCQTIYERESLNPDVKESLGFILAVVERKKQDEMKSEKDRVPKQ